MIMILKNARMIFYSIPVSENAISQKHCEMSSMIKLVVFIKQ